MDGLACVDKKIITLTRGFFIVRQRSGTFFGMRINAIGVSILDTNCCSIPSRWEGIEGRPYDAISLRALPLALCTSP
jgi:hypothetical protein